MEKEIPLRIGSCITIACTQLPTIIKTFKQESTAPIHLKIASAKTIMNALNNNEIDIALYEGIQPNTNFISIPLSSYTLAPICSLEHHFTKQTNIALEDFLNETLILREQGSAIRDVFDNSLGTLEKRANPMMESTNSQAIIKAVEANLGVSLLPHHLIENNPLLHSFQIKNTTLVNHNWIVYHKNKYQSIPFKTFLSLIEDK
ncbi:LysR substrate-binding domain-containing protein [Breznakia sp. PF5-3]|uniref:LysR substrate-binding domain-containing protein n=1 Tax=unclassified Breznakia TaxID=2623764 RepID=UPI003217AE09